MTEEFLDCLMSLLTRIATIDPVAFNSREPIPHLRAFRIVAG